MYGTSFPSTNNCTLHWIQQRLDQFSSSTSETFLQRYYTYDLFWNKGVGPVFFYTGNEADVGLYVNNTGLMWQNAQSLGALLIFAEHRYYGLSQPSRAFPSPLAYLSHEQALADYAVLIDSVKTSFSAQNCPFITFGGSYGGMLAAWMRLKYPALVEGAISASAPLLAFAGEAPAWPSQSYYRVVTESAQYYSAACADNIRAAFPLLDSEGSSEAGRARLQAYFSLCTLPMNASAVEMLKYYVRDAFDELAMGNYPFASSYIGGTAEHPLPAYPLRQACGFLMDPGLSQSPATLFPALSLAVGVLYNASQAHSCFDLPNYPTPLAPQTPVDGIWDWQWCTERMPDSFWFSTDGSNDMFWNNPFNQTLVDEHCALAWNQAPRSSWVAQEYGGRKLLQGGSNIVFSSGSFDGWSSAGVAANLSGSVTSLLIAQGAHHLDLMFSRPEDPPSVVAARQLEMSMVQKWVAGYKPTVVMSWGDLI